MTTQQQIIDTSGAHVDGGDREALRMRFEDRFPPPKGVTWDGERYTAKDVLTNAVLLHHVILWNGYQAGHAAAKAEPADVGEPVAHALIFNDGGEDLMQWPICSDEQDARTERQRYAEAVRKDIRIAPLYTADQLAAAVAKERERCAQVCERIADAYNRREGLKYPELKTDAETGANDCADAIRAGAKEPSDG